MAARSGMDHILIVRSVYHQATSSINRASLPQDFNIEGDGLQGHALYDQGFVYCWSGARANFGITGGKYCFGCKILSSQPVDMEDTPPDQQHVCRVGISRGDDAVGNLGETNHSFGFGGTGRFSNAGKFSDYGTKFSVGDTIICAVNLENKSLASIGFSKNGKWLGIAKQFDAGPKGLGVVDSPTRNLKWESALFPHVLLKNVIVHLQFSVEDGLVPEEGYNPWASALEDGNAIMGPTFSSPKDCEVLMMVGLPASGKTTWAEKWVKEHPGKRYVLLGTNLALDQMKVPGLLRKQNYGERFDRLMDRATGIFNTLLARAAKTPRNYILDQTNVYMSARKRKLKPFVNYRKVAVVIFPKPDELKLRAAKRFKEMGKEVPAEAVNEMLANYVLPTSKDMPGSAEFFDQVMFPELGRAESQRYLDEMKRALGSPSNFKPNSNLSPYSHESSIHSYNSPSLQNHAPLPAPSGHWKNSHSPLPQPDYDYRRPQQMNPTYSGTALHGKPEYSLGEYQSGLSNPSIPRDSPHGTYSNYGRSFLPRDDSNAHGYGKDDLFGRPDYGGIDPYNRSGLESRSAIPVGSNRYQSYYEVDPSGRSNFGRESLYSPPIGRSSFSNSGRHLGDPLSPQPALQAPRGSQFLHSPLTTSYGSPYGTPPLSAGPPNGTPPPRPSYENFPTSEWRQSGGCAPPGPRYY
ncbi:PREDICTED: heterogeneous nuclear ribonucleoprotein U-like protein 1 isoform X2 [Nelumbo nucifera]|uniref:SPRY domain-containing protein n=2 Tax=Nelumbo nucifera TaxID=4432 RepID=A0A822XKG9_NELNU|nr:PREDICTED: heterogeneous nuclear ribonucleoprotein U-like protein 1 isoform X2 [Nelumbo nucifera]DAD20787.1 TPA_asm: hypothetical protein HUJ06_022250 [Nelumbo nucifera]